jgi:hypothetical protein
MNPGVFPQGYVDASVKLATGLYLATKLDCVELQATSDFTYAFVAFGVTFYLSIYR